MSLIKNKGNYELWGEVPMFHGKGRRPRFRTRMGYIVNRRIDDTHTLILSAQRMGIAEVMDRRLTTEREYVNSKKFAFYGIMRFGEPCSINIVARTIIFENRSPLIPREHRQFRMTDKPIGK